MDFDFALVLVALTFLAALGWVYDRVMLSANRRQRIAVAAAQAAENGTSLSDDTLDGLNKENPLIDTARSLFPVLFIVLILRSFWWNRSRFHPVLCCQHLKSVILYW